MTDPTPPHWRAPSGTCPHCATASLAAAWQAGVEKTCEEMQPRIEALEEHIANMLEMQECACGYDNPMDVCLGHATVLKRIEALEAENGRMREALEQLDAPCSCHPAFSDRGLQDPECPAGDYGDIARGGLGKPPICQFNLRIAAIKGEDTAP